VAGTLGVGRQTPDLVRICRADNIEPDDHLFEVRRRVVDAIFLGVAKGRPNVRRRVVDGNLIQRREPRQLGEQSKRGPHHQKLQRRGALFRATPRKRLV
jgi:hypothetical protein